MQISIASYAFHGLLRLGRMDLFGYLEACRYRYHLGAADIWNGMAVSTDEDYLLSVREALDKRELELANLCVDGAHIWGRTTPAAGRPPAERALAHLHPPSCLAPAPCASTPGGRELTWTKRAVRYHRRAVPRVRPACRGRRLPGGA